MPIFGYSERQVEKAVAAALEKRASLENPSVSLADPNAWAAMFGAWQSTTGVSVTPDKAMGVAAFWSGVNFLASTIASVPLYLYDVTDVGQVKATKKPLFGLLNEAPNEETSSFAWRQAAMVSLLHHGRHFSLIERTKAQQVRNLWPLDYDKMTVERKDGRKRYTYREEGRAAIPYDASQVLDIVWSPKADGIGHYDPIQTLRDSLGLTISLDQYAAKFFQNGGVPPLQLVGPLNSPDAVKRAQSDIVKALRAAQEEGRAILPMPSMHELKPIGVDPEKGQMVEQRRFQLEETARILGLPPTFLQDLTHGTFSNTEQQDLHFVKHTVRQWFRRWEDEMNLKLISPRNRTTRIRFDEDELLRGDFKTRMEGYAQAIQNAITKPDEVREALGWPRVGGAADELYIQGATVKLGSQPAPAPTPPADPGDDGGPVNDDE